MVSTIQIVMAPIFKSSIELIQSHLRGKLIVDIHLIASIRETPSYSLFAMPIGPMVHSITFSFPVVLHRVMCSVHRNQLPSLVIFLSIEISVNNLLICVRRHQLLELQYLGSSPIKHDDNNLNPTDHGYCYHTGKFANRQRSNIEIGCSNF